MIAQKSDLEFSKRPRRLRTSAALRNLVAETTLSAQNLAVPYFVVPGTDREQPISALPGISRYSVDLLMRQLERALRLGIHTAVLFGVVPAGDKSAGGERASDPNGPVANALREARVHFGNDLVLITDVCLCGHTDHGHCGVLSPTSRGLVIDNDASLPLLAQMALTHAEAGADLVSPSDMMDGRVTAIRQALDAGGHSGVGILSYAVKYASAFYGPFREAAGSAPKVGGVGPPPPKDRKTYQMDPRNAREALREAALDEEEGADMLMVKPALPYLDILARLRSKTSLPLVAYNVSGEYAMIKAASRAGALDEASAVQEALTAIRRAGADLIFTYHAVEAVEQGWLH
ncbi:MAG: porphobilinogen synthase [Trueperaceae bacterium]|nr:MAG: porphobilinogen synthase [Trueperaceae bacterium]